MSKVTNTRFKSKYKSPKEALYSNVPFMVYDDAYERGHEVLRMGRRHFRLVWRGVEPLTFENMVKLCREFGVDESLFETSN